jgi:hypothetical protein
MLLDSCSLGLMVTMRPATVTSLDEVTSIEIGDPEAGLSTIDPDPRCTGSWNVSTMLVDSTTPVLPRAGL